MSTLRITETRHASVKMKGGLTSFHRPKEKTTKRKNRTQRWGRCNKSTNLNIEFNQLYTKSVRKISPKFCPHKKVDPFNLVLDLHQFEAPSWITRNRLMGNLKSIMIQPLDQDLVKGRSTVYPIESQGHHLKTILDSVQDDFRNVERFRDFSHTKKNLKNIEEKLSENREVVIRAADKGGCTPECFLTRTRRRGGSSMIRSIRRRLNLTRSLN